MTKVDVELVKMVLQRNELDVRLVSQILQELSEEVQNQVDAEPALPAVKKQFVMMVSDPKGELKGRHYTGWVLQIPEEDSPYVAEERICKAAYEFNTTPKGRRMPVKTIGEACEVVSSRIFKEQNVWVKNKEPVLLVTTTNSIPQEVSEKKDRAFEEVFA